MAGTPTSHAPPVADVALRVLLPIFTVTDTPSTVPVVPPKRKPAPCSMLLTTSSPVTAGMVSDSIPASCTVTVVEALASL